MTTPVMKGPGIVFLYPGIEKPIQFADATVMEWPTAENNDTLTFKFFENNVGWQIGRTGLPYVYVEKLVQ